MLNVMREHTGHTAITLGGHNMLTHLRNNDSDSGPAAGHGVDMAHKMDQLMSTAVFARAYESFRAFQVMRASKM